MSQFPSLTKRREHTFAHGLRQRYPEPAETELVFAGESFIVEPPISDPMKQAAWLDRFLNYGPKYGEIDGRYGGHLAWRVAPAPVRYLMGPVDDVFCQLAEAYIRKAPQGYPLDWLVPGQVLYPGSTNPPQMKVVDVRPLFTNEDLLTQLWGKAQSGPDWLANNNGGLCQVLFDCPARTADLVDLHGNSYTQKRDEESVWLYGGAYRGDGRGNLVKMAINLILWGHTYAAEGLGTPETSYWVQNLGFATDLWLTYIERFAGRILWQMAHTETCLMLSDLFNADGGGRGGIVQKTSGTFKGKPAPPVNPPLPRSTWQHVAPYVDEALSGLIKAATAALITAL